MATNKNAKGLCDTCGFAYPLRVLRMNSYGMMVCPEDFEGNFDLKNHPQNRTPNTRDDETLRNPRPPLNNDRNVAWQLATTEWENETTEWNMV